MSRAIVKMWKWSKSFVVVIGGGGVKQPWKLLDVSAQRPQSNRHQAAGKHVYAECLGLFQLYLCLFFFVLRGKRLTEDSRQPGSSWLTAHLYGCSDWDSLSEKHRILDAVLVVWQHKRRGKRQTRGEENSHQSRPFFRNYQWSLSLLVKLWLEWMHSSHNFATTTKKKDWWSYTTKQYEMAMCLFLYFKWRPCEVYYDNSDLHGIHHSSNSMEKGENFWNVIMSPFDSSRRSFLCNIMNVRKPLFNSSGSECVHGSGGCTLVKTF